jgi:hypothetical protein
MTDDLKDTANIAAARKPHEHDIAGLVPLIMPYDWLESEYPGPIMPLMDLPFSLVWAVRSEPQYFTYVTYDMAQYWEESGIDWSSVAMENMRRFAEAKRFDRSKTDESGRTLIVILYPGDGLGPSRLLVPDLFNDIFGEDYLVAIPEGTFAVAYRKDLPASEMVNVDGFIEHCYSSGTNPMSPERFEARRFMIKHLDAKLTYD